MTTPVHRKTVLAVGEMGAELGFWCWGGLAPEMWVFGVEGQTTLESGLR